jgi:hypothetical protein
VNRAGKHMASRKMAKNDTGVSNDSERAEQLAVLGEQMASNKPKSGVTLYRVAHGFTVDNLGSRIVGHMMPPRHGEIVIRAINEAAQTGAEITDSPWWRADPSVEDGGPIAKLLMALSRSPRGDDDSLSLRDALDLIGFLIIWYRSGNSDDSDFSQERNELDKIHKKTIELIADIRACGVLDDQVEKLEGRLGAKPHRASSTEHTLATLEGFVGLVATKREHWVHKRGRKSKSRGFVDAIIQTIEEYTGGKVERSKKRGAAGAPVDAVQKIVAIMDPEIGSGTIDEALKARSKARGEIKRQKR